MAGRVALSVGVAVLVLAAPFALGEYGLAVRQWFGPRSQNIDTSITRETNQYLTSQQQGLVQKMEDWRRIEVEASKSDNPEPLRAQQKAIVSSMKVAAATLQPEQVPSDVRAFLVGW